MKKTISMFISLLSGIIFGAGLVLSGMTDTHKVIGFLDVFSWDYDLIFVMIGAISITSCAYFISKKMKTPITEINFRIPNSTVIDKKLIIGAILFGIGWALFGLCPAPAIISLTYNQPASYLFFIAMLTGFYMSQFLARKG